MKKLNQLTPWLFFVCVTFSQSLVLAQGAAEEADETPVSEPGSLESLNPSTEPIYIEHPLAEKGLRRITRKGEYIYDVERSPQTRAAAIKVGVLNLSNLTSETDTGTIFFEDVYTDSANTPAILFEYEWQLFKSFGKLGINVGSGIFTTSGSGVFRDGSPAQEKFTFIATPNLVGATYRASYWDNQIIVPYGCGGIYYFTFIELRDDDKGPKFGGAPAAYFCGGVALNVGFLETSSLLELDRAYGINSVFFTFEFRSLVGLHDKLDFTADVFNGGITVEF